MSGAALQGAMRNPLAEPYLLGVSGGAAVGAVHRRRARTLRPRSCPSPAFAGALAAVALTLVVAHAAGGRGDARILLMAGVVVGAFANAAIMVALANARRQRRARRALVDDGLRRRRDAGRRCALLARLRRASASRALLALGARDRRARARRGHRGRARRRRRARRRSRVYVAGALLAAATVAAAGLVGFVGLVVPHLVRIAGARTHRTHHRRRRRSPARRSSSLADLVARVARPPAELPLGAVTALIGVPFFLARLRRLA